jgi:hypothetical protein
VLLLNKNEILTKFLFREQKNILGQRMTWRGLLEQSTTLIEIWLLLLPLPSPLHVDVQPFSGFK